MKSLLGIVVAIASISTAHAQVREFGHPTRAAQPFPAVAAPMRAPEIRLVPLPPRNYEIGPNMTSEEVLGIAATELAAIQKFVDAFGEQPGIAELRATAEEHWAEGARRLGAEVKAALDPKPAKIETPEEVFRREVEQLGKDVAAILSAGSIGPTKILPTGSVGNNDGRQAPTNGGAKKETVGGKAIGAGWAGALGRD